MRRITVLLSTFALMTSIISCSTTPEVATNPLLEMSEWETPFGVPPFDKIKAEHYMPAFEQAFSLHNEEIAAIVASSHEPTFENTILAYDASGKMLTDVYNIFGMIEAANTNEQLQAINEELMPKITAHTDGIALNEKLFAKVKSVYDQRAKLKLDEDQTRLLNKVYNSFVRGGALLGAEQKKELQTINEQLALMGVKFGSNLLAENNAYKLVIDKAEDLEGLPVDVKRSAKSRAEGMGLKDSWVFTLQAPSWIPFVTYSEKRDLREQIYKAYINRGNNGNELDNNALVADFAKLRQKKAALLGFDSYSAYVIDDQMAKTPAAAYKLLNNIWTPALKTAKSELAQMEELLKADDPKATFESWDWWYYAELLRKKNYNLNEDMTKPYFSESGVQNGIFQLANRLYGITFRPIAVVHYAEDCSAYEVLDVDNSHIGVLYIDLHARASKRQGAWCGNYREQRYEDGERLSPVVSIVCNFTPPSGSTPVLLTIDETETFFHEFGHALHFLFQNVKYRGIASVEGDFVELPSQIMENWAFEPEFLKLYAFHYRTNEVIPDSLVEKIANSSKFNQGFMTTELAAAALSDLDIHSLNAKTISSLENAEQFEDNALITKRGLISQIEPRYHYTYFSHIFDGGYASGYYFYLWAEVLDKDAFNAFKQSGDLFNKELAASFRHNILERGGSRSGMDMYRAFRGAEPNQDALLISRGMMEDPAAKVETEDAKPNKDVELRRKQIREGVESKVVKRLNTQCN